MDDGQYRQNMEEIEADVGLRLRLTTMELVEKVKANQPFEAVQVDEDGQACRRWIKNREVEYGCEPIIEIHEGNKTFPECITLEEFISRFAFGTHPKWGILEEKKDADV